MEKSNKIYLVIIIICSVLVVGLCGYAIMNHKEIKETDAIKFKNEYESLNGYKNENSDKEYMKVEIDNENPIIYKTGQEILDILKKENAIVYFGFASCPWCRNAVPILLDAAKEEGLDKIYYVDILNIRDQYKFSGSIEPEMIKKGTDAYYDILKFLDKKLEKYYVTDDSGNMYDTGVKRLYAPTVLAVKDGKALDLHVSTLDSQEDPYTALTDEQKKELKDIYKEMIKKVNDNNIACKQDEAC